MALSIAGININQRGGKSAILLRDNERFSHVFERPAESPFSPGNHDKDETALRQNIVFRLNDEFEKFFWDLDEWAMAYITEHSERLLGKAVSADQVNFGFVSNVKKQEGKPPLVKLKLNMPGSQKATRCWSEQGEPIDFISDWVGKSVKLKILVSHLWVMGSGSKSEFGFVCIVTDVMEEKQLIEFPF